MKRLIAVAGLAAASCLPLGPAPAGTQVLATRASAGVEVLAASGDVHPLLVWQARADGDGSDVFVTSWSAKAGVAPLRPLAEHVVMALSRRRCPPDRNPYACRLVVDDRGGVLLMHDVHSAAGTYQGGPLARFDLATGASLALGDALDFEPSVSGRRIVVHTQDATQIRVVESDGRSTAIDHVMQYLLVGDDLFYLIGPPPQPDRAMMASPRQLRVLHADGTSAAIDDRVASFDAIVLAETTQLLVRGPEEAGEVVRAALLDPTTLHETDLPNLAPSTELSFSPDGRWLALARSDELTDSNRHFKVLDRNSGTFEMFDAEAPSVEGSLPLYWRPHHDEAWILGKGRLITVWRPGQVPERRLGDLAYFSRAVSASPFTADGARWFVLGYDAVYRNTGYFPVYLTSADPPLTAEMRLNGTGTGISDLIELPDGRLLTRTWTTLPERGDIHVVDPARGTIRDLASGGIVAASDNGRALALLNWIERAAEGDLTLLDLDTAARTRLAENVLGFSAHQGRGALAPGAPLAYVVRSPLASPYDGVWVTTLP
jgi:hypothetical protein